MVVGVKYYPHKKGGRKRFSYPEEGRGAGVTYSLGLDLTWELDGVKGS